MIFQQSQETLDQWKNEMHNYEKGKRTKKPFGSNRSHVEYVTYQKIKNKECLFNPVLQTFQKPDDERKFEQKTSDLRAKSLINHLKNTIKYEKSFDIINLNTNDPSNPKPQQRKLGPIRNAYNVINNQQLPEYYFKNRDIRLPIERQKRLYDYHKKDFNIVNNVYKENHEQKMEKQIYQQVQQINNKYWATHNYNPVNGHFYDANKQQEFQKEQKVKQKQHGKDFQERLPVSYVYREPLILDYSKPLPESLKILDERNHNAKKRFDTKYIVLDEYEKRNVQQDAKHEKSLKNHIHFGRILDEKYKSFDIINNQAYRPTRAQQLFGKKVEVTWEQLTKQAAKPQSFKQGIKSGGFA